MGLYRLTERIWVYPYEEKRDRPNLSYVRGDRWSLAVDAGHSGEHTKEFYRALENRGLPLPSVTVLTHWHWDHTFGMHAVNGLCIANRQTAERLRIIRDEISQNGPDGFLSWHESIRKEYAKDKPVIVTLPDILFSGEMLLDAGNCPIRLFQTEAPHTDDSTLILVPDEKVLFIGDAEGGPFPDFNKRDPALVRKLAKTIRETDADICLESHWTPVGKAELMHELLEESNG